MRPWDTFSAREADDFDHDGLAEALATDWDLLNRHYWREDLKKRYGEEFDEDALDLHADLADAVIGTHPTVQESQQASAASVPPTDALQEERDDEPDSKVGVGWDNSVPTPQDKSQARSQGIQETAWSAGLNSQQSSPLALQSSDNQLDALMGAADRLGSGPSRFAQLWFEPHEIAPSSPPIQAGSEEANRMTHPVPPINPSVEVLRKAGSTLGRAFDWWLEDLRRPQGFEHLDPELRKLLDDTRAEIDAVLDDLPGAKGLKAVRAAIRNGRARPPASDATTRGKRARPRTASRFTRESELEGRVTKLEFRGLEVQQNDQLIDPHMRHRNHRSNLALMKDGKAPFGWDGRRIELHHMRQRPEGPLVEMSGTRHSEQQHDRIKSLIDRVRFRSYRRAYWKERARQLEQGAGR